MEMETDTATSGNSILQSPELDKKIITNEDNTTNLEGGQQLEAPGCWLKSFFKWKPTSKSLLDAAEKRILSYIKTPYKGRYVDIGKSVGKTESKIWTLSLNEECPKTPLVLVHGFASGTALWCLNFDALAESRPVHAFDVLGFGKSSRPNFSSGARHAEAELVDSIEDWRKSMGLEKFVLLGHSMGGFLVTSYAIKYPNRVSHLILADPWGYQDVPDNMDHIPARYRVIGSLTQSFNPLFLLRFAGPYGPGMIGKMRPELIAKFDILNPGNPEETKVGDYIYHCNAQNPSGEAAFTAMRKFAWAKYPVIHRLDDLDPNVPMTIIYGAQSWIDSKPGEAIQEKRGQKSYVNIEYIEGAGHHVYADNLSAFHELVLNAAGMADKQNGNEKQKSAEIM